MPLSLIAPKPGRTPNYRIRGTYLGVAVDKSAETHLKADATALMGTIKRAIEQQIYGGKSAVTIGDAAQSYVLSGGENRFLAPIIRHFGKTMPLKDIEQIGTDKAAEAIYPGRSPATKNRQFYTPLLAIAEHAHIALHVSRPCGADGEHREIWLKPDELEHLVRTALEIDREFAVLIIFLCYTGLRLSEALRVTCRDIELDQAQAIVGKTKNGDPRGIYLPPRVIAELANHPRGLNRQEPLFGWTKTPKLYALAESVYAAAGIDCGGAPFHVMRHTFGAWMKRAGADLVRTGVWKSQSGARRYSHFAFNEEAAKASLLPGSTRLAIVQGEEAA